MGMRWRQWWPVGKALLALVILIAVGRLFARDLHNPELWQRPLRPGWLVVSAVLYLLGLGFSAFYWSRLLRRAGQHPSAWTVIRAYYLGQMGKYVPGKAWALLLRATLAHGPQVRGGIAALTAFYEVLTTMAAGVLVAAGLFAVLLPSTAAPLDWNTFVRLLTLQTPAQPILDNRIGVLLSLVLLVPVGLPLVPPLFNRLAHRLSLPFRQKDAEPLPQIGVLSLLEGLGLTAIGWLFLGAGVFAGLQATAPQPLPWTPHLVGLVTACLGLSYVAGFVILVVPGAVGVREFFLTLFLTPALLEVLAVGDREARLTVELAVLAVRLAWTVGELLLAGVLLLLGLLARRRPEPVSTSAEVPRTEG